jgi:hypothetical protein
MKHAQRHIHLTRSAITTGAITYDDLKESARSMLGTVERHDILDKVLPSDIDLDKITRDDIKIPTLWALIRDRKFWGEVVRELIFNIIILIIKTKRHQQ